MGCNNSKRCCFYKGPTQKERREALAERARLQALEIRERAVLDKVRAREENLAGALLTTLCRAYINCPRYGRHEWMHQGPADGSRYRLLGVKRKINYHPQPFPSKRQLLKLVAGIISFLKTTVETGLIAWHRSCRIKLVLRYSRA